MTSLSWTVVGVFLALTFAIGLWFARRAATNTQEYFLSGRTLPWWIIGTSMVITTFAPDTPLGVASNVRTSVSYGWFGWNMVMAQVLSVFLFARLWRRSGVMTDNELLELRYNGRSAAGLRVYKAFHFSILANVISLSLIMRAIVDVIIAVTDIPAADENLIAWGLAGIALTYAVLAGFWGVVATDFLQFWVAIAGTVIFAFIAADRVGGVEAVAQAVSSDSLAFFPEAPDHQFKVLAYMGIMWWAIYNADGAGYLCQRMLAAKNEWHASVGTLWFSVAYAAIRMWPWVLIGSLSLVVFPLLEYEDGRALVNGEERGVVTGTVRAVVGTGPQGKKIFEDREVKDLVVTARDGKVVDPGGTELQSIEGRTSYPRMMRRFLDDHPFLLGVLVAAFLAAFLSTVDTLLNWGASYLVNDVFRRFVRPQASERQLVWMGKGSIVAVMAAAVMCFQFFRSIKDAWIFVWAFSAGIGPVLIMRWFWWRVNAWCEILALASSVLITVGFEVCNAVWQDPYVFASGPCFVGGTRLEIWHKAIIVVASSISVAVLAVRFAPSTDPERLDAFVRKVRPPGFWGPVRARVGAEGNPDHSLGQVLLMWVLGVAVVYGLTFVIGGIIYQRPDVVWPSLVALVVGCAGLWPLLRR